MAVKGLDQLSEDDFKPREPRQSARRDAEQGRGDTWPSREPRVERAREPDGALSIKGPSAIIERFKRKTNNGRDIKYYAMLDAMMNFCDRNGFNAKLEMMTDEERAEAIRAVQNYR